MQSTSSILDTPLVEVDVRETESQLRQRILEPVVGIEMAVSGSRTPQLVQLLSRYALDADISEEITRIVTDIDFMTRHLYIPMILYYFPTIPFGYHERSIEDRRARFIHLFDTPEESLSEEDLYEKSIIIFHLEQLKHGQRLCTIRCSAPHDSYDPRQIEIQFVSSEFAERIQEIVSPVVPLNILDAFRSTEQGGRLIDLLIVNAILNQHVLCTNLYLNPKIIMIDYYGSRPAGAIGRFHKDSGKLGSLTKWDTYQLEDSYENVCDTCILYLSSTGDKIFSGPTILLDNGTRGNTEVTLLASNGVNICMKDSFFWHCTPIPKRSVEGRVRMGVLGGFIRDAYGNIRPNVDPKLALNATSTQRTPLWTQEVQVPEEMLSRIEENTQVRDIFIRFNSVDVAASAHEYDEGEITHLSESTIGLIGRCWEGLQRRDRQDMMRVNVSGDPSDIADMARQIKESEVIESLARSKHTFGGKRSLRRYKKASKRTLRNNRMRSMKGGGIKKLNDLSKSTENIFIGCRECDFYTYSKYKTNLKILI
jgi:hypothetical protein